MRGTFADNLVQSTYRRFIPAYAGNMGRYPCLVSLCAVHPRVCGEHIRFCVLCIAGGGSSPRMRGTCVPSVSIHCSNRFIPAYAGNMHHPLLSALLIPVHPRVCGEHFVTSYHVPSTGGSSPRMRGTWIWIIWFRVWYRFIPAYAGNILGLLI